VVPVNSAMASSQRTRGLRELVVGMLFMSRIVNKNGEAAIIREPIIAARFLLLYAVRCAEM
jgi:hypothetical protein